MIPATIEQWAARADSPGARRYHVSSSGRTILYTATLDGLGRQFALYLSSTDACRAIDSGDIAWRLDLRHEIKRRAVAEKVPA